MFVLVWMFHSDAKVNLPGRRWSPRAAVTRWASRAARGTGTGPETQLLRREDAWEKTRVPGREAGRRRRRRERAPGGESEAGSCSRRSVCQHTSSAWGSCARLQPQEE